MMSSFHHRRSSYGAGQILKWPDKLLVNENRLDLSFMCFYVCILSVRVSVEISDDWLKVQTASITCAMCGVTC